MDNLSRVGARARSTVQSANTNGVERKDKEYGNGGTKFERPRTGKPKGITRFTDASSDESLTGLSPSRLSETSVRPAGDARGRSTNQARKRVMPAIAHVVHTVPRSPKRYDNIALMLPASAASANFFVNVRSARAQLSPPPSRIERVT